MKSSDNNYTPIKMLTKGQLAEIVSCYATEFPGWKIVESQALARVSDTLVQHIGFERLRSGAYRPMAAVWPRALPTASMLHQFLDPKHRQVYPREHPTRWKQVVIAMEEQFRPSIRKPIDVHEVLELCEEEAKTTHETSNTLSMLAILNTYAGNEQRVIALCDQVQVVGPPVLAPSPAFERRDKDFALDLKAAIQAGRGLEFLQAESKQADRSG